MDERDYDVYAELMKHAIGMDRKKHFRHDGDSIYVPYRNYYTVRGTREEWEDLVEAGYAVKKPYGKDQTWYSLTPSGIQWLVNYTHIYICLTY